MAVTMVPQEAGERGTYQAPVSSERRLVFQTSEYQEVPIPIDLLVVDGRLDIYPELLRTTVLRTYSRDGKLLFQAGGWIGFIPVNDRVAIEVRPRVPIANLERVLCIAGNTSPLVLKGHLRAFSRAAGGLPASLIDILAERLAVLAEACWSEGLHSEYVRRVQVGQNPRGRLLPFATAKHRTRTHDLLSTVSEQYVRTHDTGPNQCIAAALDRLHTIYSGIRNRAGVRSLASRLGRARQLLLHVNRVSETTFLSNPLVIDPTRLPASRPSYPATVALAKIVLTGSGIDLRSTSGHISLPPMMISMETAFESYLRNVLLEGADGILVQDGNARPPTGASANLFHDAPLDSPLRKTQSTPDIVCSSLREPTERLVIDVKYKPETSRDDLNQVLGYALTYRSNAVLLACPRKSASSPIGLQLLGEVAGVKVYHYFVDLGASDLEQEERGFITAIRQLLPREIVTTE